MLHIKYSLVVLICSLTSALAISNDTLDEIPESYANLTAGNSLWSSLLKDCKTPTLACIKHNIYDYLKNTLDYPNDLQFTSFMKFAKNTLDYAKIQKQSWVVPQNETDIFYDEDTISPLQEMSRSLHDNTIKFLMTHDLELQLPESVFEGTTLKVSPRSFEENGALVKLEFVPKAFNNEMVEGRLFKKLKKFVSEKLVYALLAILLVIKLLAAKFLFVMPLIVGAAAAKKLLIKVLLFLFPALHHLFKFCAYVPHGTKFHHHKHQISHVHHIGHGHGHGHGPPIHHKPHGHYEVIAPHAEGPPDMHQYGGPHKSTHEGDEDLVYYNGGSLDNELISHRHDPDEPDENEVDSWGQGQQIRRDKPGEKRPLTPTELENMILKAEKEALIKTRLQQERQKIHEENLRLQEQLNNAIKLQQKLKHHASVYSAKIPATPFGHHPVKQPTSQFQNAPLRPQVAAPATRLSSPPQGYPAIQQQLAYSKQPVYQQHQPEVPSENVFVEPVQHQKQPVAQAQLQQDFQNAATITYDGFYSPILDKIDRILGGLGFNDEPCRERLICSMYKNPTKFSPHSNLLSAELSRDSKELQKPTSTNAAVIRFYKYVQAARDGQDRRDCIRLYASCSIITE